MKFGKPTSPLGLRLNSVSNSGASNYKGRLFKKWNDLLQVRIQETLTDIIVLVSLSKLLPECKRGKALKFFGEALGAVEGVRAVALPTDLVLGAWLAVLILFPFHEVQGVALHGVREHSALVVGTDDVQVVVQVDLHGVIFLLKPESHKATLDDVATSHSPVIHPASPGLGWQ